MNDNRNVTWQWLAGSAIGAIIFGGGAWMTTMYAEVNAVKKEQVADRKSIGEIDKKVGVIEEQTKRTREDVHEIKESQKDTNRKLDELLRRR